MRRRLVNRGLAMLLAVALVFGMMPMNAYASEASDPVVTEDQQDGNGTGEQTPDDSTPVDEGSTTEPCDHSWGEFVVTTEATTEAEGVKTSTCASCGETKTESIPVIVEEHTHSYAEVTVAATCTEAGSITYTCECEDTYSEVIEALGHTWGEWSVTKEATTTAEGEKTRVCSVCGASENEVIPMVEVEVNETFEYVKGLIADLPTEITSDAQAAEVEGILNEINAIAESDAISGEEYQQLDWEKVVIVTDAVNEWYESTNDQEIFEAAQNPTWDTIAQNPYVINVPAGEAGLITKQQLYSLLSEKWSTELAAYDGVGFGGYKYGNNTLKNPKSTDSAGLVKDTVYSVSTAKVNYKKTFFGVYVPTGETWTEIESTFKVVEAEENDVITVEKTSILVPFNKGIDTVNQIEEYRTAIINALGTITVNGSATYDSTKLSIQFHYFKDNWISADDDYYLELNSANVSKYDSTEASDKMTFRVSYGTSDYVEVVVTLEDSRLSAGLEDKVFDSVVVLEDEDELNAYIKTLIQDTEVNPNEIPVDAVEFKLTEGTWPPAKAGDTVQLVYTITYKGSDLYTEDTAKLTVSVQAAYGKCTVVGDDALLSGGTLSVTPSDDNKTVNGNTVVTVAVNPNSDKVVETIAVTNKTTNTAVEISDITYKNKKATVTFKTDGSVASDEYVVSATYSDSYLNLKSDQTIVYCYDDEDHEYDLQKLVFDAIFDGSSAPMTKENTKLEYKYGSLGDLWTGWQDVSQDPSFSVGTHKFGEKVNETVKLTYSDDKYGTFEQEVILTVFDSCYNVEVGVQTITNGAEATIKTQYSTDSKEYMGTKYFKSGTELTVTLTPDGKLVDVLEQLYNGTYSESMAYIENVTVYERGGAVVPAEVVRGQGKLDLGSIMQGVNPLLYNASVTFTLDVDKDYFVVAEYGILKLERQESDVEMPMYQGGTGYVAEVPTQQEIIDAVLGKEYAQNFLNTYGGSFEVEYSTDLISYTWTKVSDEALLALNDQSTIRVRITWKPADGDKTYYPVAQQANLSLIDGRIATEVVGENTGKQVNFISEDKLVEELKEALKLGISAEGEVINVDYVVTYNLEGNETDGFTADVTLTYEGSSEYKPVSKTFEDVPVANRPDDATVAIDVQNAEVVVTNNDNKVQELGEEGIYTVIGNGTYYFVITPEKGTAIESVAVRKTPISSISTVDAEEAELVEVKYDKQVVSFSMMLDEKFHYDVIVETVSSEWVLEDECVYDFATGISKADNAEIVDAVVSYPADIDYEDVKVEYLARKDGNVTVSLPDINLGFTVIELGTFDIELGELWLNPEESTDMVSEDQLDKILDKLVDDVIFKISNKELTISNAVPYITDYIKNLPLGIHAFGVNGDGSTETVRFSYEDDKYLLAEKVVDVTIHDYRIATELNANDCEVTFGYNTAQLVAASGAQITADGAVVSGIIKTDDLYLHVKADAQNVTLYFAGDENYQPCKTTINVVVNKAACSIDYDSQTITYGDEYDLALSVSPSVMPDGTVAEIDRVEFLVGLDAHKLLDLDITDKSVGFDQAVGFVQIRLPESIRNLPLVGEYLQGEFTLSEFSDLINSLSDVLGIDESSIEILNQVMEAITGITDRMDIKVIVEDEEFHPDNMGVYIAGAVTVDADFETAYTADYLIIAPKTTQCELAWNYNDQNGVMTLPAYQEVFKDLIGAHVVENAENGMTGDVLNTANSQIKYLVLGINDETSDFLTTDVYGNIKANIWTSNDAINDNGAYVQIAYMLNWGNEIYYAVPIVRTIMIVPQTTNVQLVGLNGDANNELLKTFNNEPQGFSVKVTNAAGELIYSDHYQDAVNKLNPTDELTVTYIGLQTNTNPYNSTEKPVHAGAYAVVATLIQKDAAGNLLSVGMDAGVLVIEPSESVIDIEDSKTVVFNGNHVDLKEAMIKELASVNSTQKPDVTLISAEIASTGDFTVNGWEAVTGKVNVDFPRWMDELIAQYAPGVVDGITVAELKAKLPAMLPEFSAKLAELGATEEVLNSLGNLIGNVTKALESMPGDLVLSFNDDVKVNAVGVYMVTGIVTDSDHYPSADSGILFIVPDATEVELKFNEDLNGNNVFTPEQLKYVDLNAKAYDKATGEVNAEATARVTNLFVGVDVTGKNVTTTDASALNNGVYTQFAYIIDVNGKMYYAEPISRVIVLASNPADVYFVDKSGAENNDQVFTFDNTAKSMDVRVNLNGSVFTPDAEDLEFTYTGIQTNTKTYRSTEAPKHAGVYLVTVNYSDYNENGKLLSFGAAAGVMAIVPAESTIEVTGGTYTYEAGVERAAAVTATGAGVTDPDYTVISGYVDVDGNIDEVGVDAFNGNVNIDFPDWVDNALAAKDFEFVDGVSPAYVKEFMESYIDDVAAMIPEDKLIEAGIAAEDLEAAKAAAMDVYNMTIELLTKMPEDVTITFNDDVTYTEPGAYFYYGIVTDSDHKPSTDTGLLIIEKMPHAFDLLDTVVPYNGESQFVDVVNEVNTDMFAMIVDREENIVNLQLDTDLLYVVEKIETLTGYNLMDGVPVSSLYSELNAEELAALILSAIEEVEASAVLDPASDLYSVMNLLKEELSSLPAEGKFVVNQPAPVNVGEYEVYAMTYSEYYTTEFSQAKLEIVPVHVVIDDLDNSKVYGEVDPELEAEVLYYSYDSEGNQIYFAADELPDDIGLTYEVVREEGEDVGEYAMSIKNASIIESENYVLEVVEDESLFMISKATMLIYADDASKVYGDADPEFTFRTEGLVQNEVVNDVLTNDDVKFERAMAGTEAGENVGEYSIHVDIINEEILKNYDVDFKEECEGTLTITPAELTVVVDDKSKVYGEADPEFTAVVTGLKFEGDTADFTFSREKAGTEEGEQVGTYVISAVVAGGVNSHNYVIAEGGITSGVLTIEEKSITSEDITVSLDEELIYNGSEQTQKVVVKDKEKVLVEGTDYILENNTAANVDAEKNYNLVVRGIGNYKDTCAMEWNITPAEVTITVADAAKVYGEDDPENDPVVAVTKGSVDLDVELTRENGEDVGSYAYNVIYAESANYNVTEEFGALTITQKDINSEDIKVELNGELIYNGTEQTQKVTVTDGTKDLAAESDYTVTGNVQTDVADGTYVLVITGNGNYTGTRELEWNIAPLAYKVVVDDASKVYGMADPEPVISVYDSNETKLDEIPAELEVDVIREDAANENVGEYDYNVDYTDSLNYDVTVEAGKLTIVKAEIVVTLNDTVEVVVDESMPEEFTEYTVEVTTDGAVYSEEELQKLIDSIELKLFCDGDTSVLDAEYDVEAEFIESDNYEVTVEGKVVIILGDYICWDTVDTYYNDVTDALDAERRDNKIVQMLKDATSENDKNEDTIKVHSGMTFDLNGCYVEADDFLSFGTVIDTFEDSTYDVESGGIKISSNTEEAWTMLQPENGGYLPIYDDNTGSYKFFKGYVRSHDFNRGNSENVRFRFQLVFEKYEGYQVYANSEEDNFDVLVDLGWTGSNALSITYAMKDDTVKGFAEAVFEDYKNGYTLKKAMYVTIINLQRVGSGNTVSAAPTVVTVPSTTSIAEEVLVYTIP